jgi:response regulator RpfG family c-di-GMP phosphodiesterase
MNSGRRAVLFVDDEPAVLDVYQGLLHREFEVEVAVGSTVALRMLEIRGPYAVVVSDMRMPDMNGIELLGKVRTLAPDTVRIMLTAHADIETAINAVNEGSVFRFLTKPADKAGLIKAISAGLAQYRLIIAEKELLERTLSGTIKVLTEVLSLVNPAAFSRATRLRRYVQHIATKLALPAPWRFEAAAMMSQLGSVTFDPEMLETVYAGQKLRPEDQARFDAHPAVARDLLSNIPRLEPVAWMIAQQRESVPLGKEVGDQEMLDTINLGAQVLRTALAFDQLLSRQVSKADAIQQLMAKAKNGELRMIQALADAELEFDRMIPRTCLVGDLSPGMILHQEVRTQTGMLVVAKGQEITSPLLIRLRNFRQKQTIADKILVLVPRAEAFSIPSAR